MSRSSEGPSDLLFDLPLDPAADAAEEVDGADESAAPGDGGDQADLDFPLEGAATMDPPAPVEAPVAPRFQAALLDLVALVAILGLALLSLRILAVPLTPRVAAPLTVFLASFSFLYTVVPLAFWGHTPGMAYAGIYCRARSGDYLTIGQCILRWFGWLLTVATAGLAALVALSGVSLPDLVSRSRTLLRPPA